jgi:glycosyltransferase involved in cell wall biosynthesis
MPAGSRCARQEPVVDVIIPTRDRLALTTESVRSVLAQTYPWWQAYLVDDASAPQTLAALQEFCAGDPRLHVVVRTEPGGPQAARQSGLAAGTSPWVALLDSDDLWEPTRLETQLRHIERRRAEGVTLDALFSAYTWVDERGETIGSSPLYTTWRPWLTNNFSTFIVARALLDAAGGFVPPGQSALWTCENLELCLRLTDVWHLDILPDVLAHCRAHASSRASDAFATRKAADELALVLSRYTDTLSRYPSTWADLEAQVGARYLNAGETAEGLRRLARSLRRGGRRRAGTIVRRYGRFTLATLARRLVRRSAPSARRRRR